jgi:hypothetical protein
MKTFCPENPLAMTWLQMREQQDGYDKRWHSLERQNRSSVRVLELETSMLLFGRNGGKRKIETSFESNAQPSRAVNALRRLMIVPTR